MEGNVKVHVESRTRLPDMEDVLHFRGSGTLERTPSGVAAAVSGPQR
ncbi:MAG: hypothetical protein ACLR01_14610 [Vescimonas sp.]